jgi:3'-5' exoribonuclease
VKDLYLEQIRERDWVDSIFLVGEKTMAMAKNGKPYMTLRLADRTGEVEGRVWDRVDEFSACFEKNDFIHVKAKASVYLGKMQLVVQELAQVAEQDVDLSDFLPVSQRSIDDMRTEFMSRIDSLTDPELKALMQAFASDQEFMRGYCLAPAAKAMHHVYLGGLLEHSLAVAALADDVSGRYPVVNRDLLVVAALLHDIGKIDELRYARSFDYSDEGKLIGHIVMGVEMIDRKICAIPSFSLRQKMLLKHMLLSHHGQYEYGSPKRPKTLEAVILNFVDDLDAKVNGVCTHMAKEPDRKGDWTSYHRLYDRYFFRDNPSPSDSFVVQDSSIPVEKKPMPTPQPKAPERSRGKDQLKRGLGFTLADQLKGKSLDLFSAEDNEKE